MGELVQLFVSELPERVKLITDSYASRDLSRLKTCAHQLRGSSGGYGFQVIGTAAAKLEDAVKALDAQDEARVIALKQQVDELVALCGRATA